MENKMFETTNQLIMNLGSVIFDSSIYRWFFFLDNSWSQQTAKIHLVNPCGPRTVICPEMMVALCHALFFQLQHRPCRLHQGEDICVSDDWGIGCSFTL
jgi:hypothetical protein